MLTTAVPESAELLYSFSMFGEPWNPRGGLSVKFNVREHLFVGSMYRETNVMGGYGDSSTSLR